MQTLPLGCEDRLWAVAFINLWGQMKKLCYGAGYYFKKVNMALDFL